MTATKMTKSIWVGCIALAASLILTACGDESPFSKAEDDLDDIRDEANNDYDDKENERDKCRYGESSHSDSWCCDNYGYQCYYDLSSSSYRQSSSSTETDYLSEYDYLTSSMTMNFTLTYYRQTVCSMEGKGSKSCNYDDGDPKISFKLIFVKSTGDSTTYSTSDKLGKKWFYYENTGEWDGNKSFTVNVPAYTEIIRVCPTVLDDDFTFDDDMSSGYCYYIRDVGLLDYREVVEQRDYENNKCELEWEWYLY